MATRLTFFSSIFLVLLTSSNLVSSCVSPAISNHTFRLDCLCGPTHPPYAIPIYVEDVDLLQFAENLEYLEADFFLYGALGYGLDVVAPNLVIEGPPPIGGMKANLDNLMEGIITEFAYQEVGHLRALLLTVGAIPRPQLDLTSCNFPNIFDEAFGFQLDPPFDPYANSLNYMLASYVIPYMGLLLAGLLGVESGQDAVIRMYVYKRANITVYPYNHAVAEFTNRTSELRNRLAMCGIKDEGIIVPPELGAENRTSSNVLSANAYSISYSRTHPC
ncbi:hypothetical protein IFM89_015783 [Coptis chinensis]|uniref:Desiccation-related protein PCC13-62 n=1 Tax=Coptis chinensis TaxID=261450 RepID=A0A835INJ1_9MAGN|nr:hypothetical protein IFM89_015783 [Coptis chinensis]